ncbi:MAG: pyruvate, phosphate dikinase [Chloroflexi bacterium]|nr:pyruvate, phosphate dikinase [Chloroflexota bacterium]
MSKWVYHFEEGSQAMRDLLGGKGAGLAEMSSAGLPVPPGFTITTSACREYYANNKHFPDNMWEQSLAALSDVEEKTGKTFGAPTNPLLLSVRSGAAVSMPGMMDTVLNLGLNQETVKGLAELTHDERFAWDAYRRFVEMFGEIVLGTPREKLLRGASQIYGASSNGSHAHHDDVETIKLIVQRYQDIIQGETRQIVPEDPYEQLRMAIAAVFDSWMNRRSIDYRRINNIDDSIGTAVSVQTMVFGNAGDDSGTGVAFTRNPSTGQPVIFGEYLTNAQGEDVVAGIRTPLPITYMAESLPDTYRQLIQIADRLETHYHDMQDIEFTIERGKLWMLQTRTGKRSGRAAVRVAVDMVREGVITKDEALKRVTPNHLEQVLHPVVDPNADAKVLTKGLPASPGAASGKVVFTADDAVKWAERGEPVILVRTETSPDDFHGMVAAEAIVTSRGGVTSHAAVVARGMGKCCVVGCHEIEIDYPSQLFMVGDTPVSAGDWVTVDGNEGQVLLGNIPTIEPILDEYFDTVMRWATEVKRLGVRANADNGPDAQVARDFGASGIGLCRTEHMFFEDERIDHMRDMIMAPNPIARAEALARLEPFQVQDFMDLFRVMDGYPVTIRLLDPPLHEFLPSHEETMLAITDRKLQLRDASTLAQIDELMREINDLTETLEQIERLQEKNPMLGHRGCRLGIVYPEVTEMQVRAIFTAAVRCHQQGIQVIPEVMIPLVAWVTEYRAQEEIVRRVASEVFEEYQIELDYTVGTMIELPRAALTANEIAEQAEFFSFGTNDLTQTTLGLSRDDSARFLAGFVANGIMPDDPFRSIDATGVGELVRFGTDRGRAARPDLKVGICGEHGGDPKSVLFFHNAGLDYVSCSPYRIPIAVLAAAHATIAENESHQAIVPA